ncbi:hypothetical protein SLG_23890 [Sphingobium sp. SYK-6]|uniref:CmcJ/NvfI family oxidoreductase n=1 Tax=Sphingobium sp. (strain NBRC 103272 / SYK-6) TaxID=627192 RepID=UPI000227736F|nr:CmcJ/NvfI family oxidoreductase [Sphingobium sp. SYK-6]BAK67064.1 hypothetical protein SLG_23890 [Sphingobium sp. SYK-6]
MVQTEQTDRGAACINYAARTGGRPRYHANDHGRDTVVVAPHFMPLVDGRAQALDLDDQGFILVPHVLEVDPAEEAQRPAYAAQVEALLRSVTGADDVVVTGKPILRFSERSGRAGSSDNSHPARFAHVDVSQATGADFSRRSQPRPGAYSRAAHYNVWRVLSPAPQDVPLALCDAGSLRGRELIEADAIFDSPAGDWSFEGYVVAHDPAHRWHWFPDMTPDEAIVFKTHDSAPDVAGCVPHVAFDDPGCPDDAQPRVSVEIRAIAYWW